MHDRDHLANVLVGLGAIDVIGKSREISENGGREHSLAVPDTQSVDVDQCLRFAEGDFRKRELLTIFFNPLQALFAIPSYFVVLAEAVKLLAADDANLVDRRICLGRAGRKADVYRLAVPRA